MWGDSSIINHTIAQLNPFRWSRSQSISQSLEQLKAYECQGVNRPVLIYMWKLGNVEKHNYSHIADAIAKLGNWLLAENHGDEHEGPDVGFLAVSENPRLQAWGCHEQPEGYSDSQLPPEASGSSSSNLEAAELDGILLPQSCLKATAGQQPSSVSPADIGAADAVSEMFEDDGIMQLLLAGGDDALLGQWLQQVVALMALRDDLSLDAGCILVCAVASADSSNVLAACKGLHKAIADIDAADRLETVLGSDGQLQSAPLVLSFLAEQVGKVEGGLREKLARDLIVLLGVPGWKRIFETRDLHRGLPDDVRFKLASSGIVLGHASEAAGTLHQDQLQNVVQEALHQATSSLVEAGARIVILGDRGAGKSSICNSAFGKVVAAARPGKSVTPDITLYEATEKCPVHIYDTKGFETLSDSEDALAQLKELIEERRQAVAKYLPDDPAAVKEQLHAIWWVIDVVGGGRFSPKSVEDVAKLFSETNVPIIMVLNKCDVEEAYVREVERSVQEHCLWASSVVRVVACPRLGPMAQLCEECGSADIANNCKRMCYSCESCGRSRVPFKANYGFDELVRVTIQCLPMMVTASFVSAQKVWLEGLDKEANRTICIFGALAGGCGAAPMPFLTHFALFPLQVTMVIRLASIYGVILSWKTGLHIVCSLGVVSTVGFLGWTAANVIKVVPGLSAVGCASDACVSATFTIAIGLMVRTMMRRVRGKAATSDIEVLPEHLAELMSIEERRSLFTAYFNRLRAPLMELMQDASATSIESLEAAIDRVGY